MRRRDFITLLGGAALASPLVARAQQAMPSIGLLHSGTRELYASRERAFHQGLGTRGYEEGRNVAVEYRVAGEQYDRMPAMAADLASRNVAVIVAGGVPGVLAAKAATSTIPIVFNIGVDPVKLGLVASMNRPGGNLTGISNLSVEVEPKRLELLSEMVPKSSLLAVLLNPANPNAEAQATVLRAAALKLGARLHLIHARTHDDLDPAFRELVKLGASGLVIGNDGLFIAHRMQLGALAARYALPTIFQFREFAAAGGLASYGASFEAPFRLAGVYAARILKGERPADLPVHQSTNIELVINTKAAHALGIAVPLPLLGRADEVIE
jgi:putative ABC transport system substrate-binding protein